MRRRAVAGVGVAVVLAFVLAWWLWPRASADVESRGPAPAPTHGRHAEIAGRPDGGATLDGRVTRASDGSPIAGARITLSRDRGELASPELTTVVTRADGTWSIAASPGRYAVFAGAVGFVPGRRGDVVVGAGGHETVAFSLAAGGTVVQGTVTDINGGPVEGARVSAEWVMVVVAFTDRAGHYELPLGDGPYTLVVEHEDYVEQYRDIVAPGWTAPVDFVLVPGSIVQGTVIARATGRPVTGARVVLTRDTASRSEPSATSQADGRFEIRSVRAGVYSIDAHAKGLSARAPSTFDIGIGETKDVQVVVDPAYAITGRVRYGATPIADADVRVYGFGALPSLTTRTAADGSFAIDGLQPALYMVRISTRDMSLPERRVEIVDRDVAVDVDVPAGVTLRGRIEPRSDEMWASIIIDGERRNAVNAKPDGTFEIAHVPAGRARLEAWNRERQGEVAISVGSTDLDGIVVALGPPTPTGSVRGRVVDDDGNPVSGALIASDDRVIATSRADGTWRATDLAPRKLSLVAGRDDGVRFAHPRYKLWHFVDVDVVAGREQGDVVLVLSTSKGQIRGQVLDAQHQPVVDARVSAVPADGGYGPRSARVLTGVDGRFVIEHLAPGTYNVDATSASENAERRVDNVAVGASITIELAPLLAVRGRVTYGGRPAQAYQIQCNGADDGQRYVNTPEGTYEIDHLGPGEYTCVAENRDGAAEGHVVVVAGATATLDLALQPFVTVTGKVVHVVTGEPVAGVVVAVESITDVLGNSIARSVTTDASGQFVLDHAPAGDAYVIVTAGRFGGALCGPTPYHVVGAHADVGAIRVVPPPAAERGTYGITLGSHFDVVAVAPGGPAERAGMRAGDTIASIAGLLVTAIGQRGVSDLLVGQVGQRDTVQLGLGRGVTVGLTATAP